MASHDLQFRPRTYWSIESIFANIKGQLRREDIEDALGSGEVEGLPVVSFADDLPVPCRDFLGGMHPWLVGGEYLPEYLAGEVEIARVALDSVSLDVVSVRACRRRRCIRYRIVDEYSDEGAMYVVKPESSEVPLSMAQLIELIDTAVMQNGCRADERTGLVRRHWDELNGDIPLDEVVSFARVSSPFYPQLGAYYEAEAAAWARQLAARRGDAADPKP